MSVCSTFSSFLEVLNVVYSLLNISVMLKMKVILRSFCIVTRGLYQSDIMFKLLSWPGTTIFHTLTKHCYWWQQAWLQLQVLWPCGAHSLFSPLFCSDVWWVICVSRSYKERRNILQPI